MSNYRRLISYIYAYEGGIKGKNVGFAKLEVRNGQCKIQVNVRNVYIGSQDTGVYLLTGTEEILVGRIFIRNGAGEFRALVAVGNIAGSGHTIDQCYGLTVHNLSDSWQCYTTIWEDAVAHAAEVALENATSERTSGEEPAESSVAVAVEAEIEAQDRENRGKPDGKEETLPSSVIPSTVPEGAERSDTDVEVMEIRPMEVLPIGREAGRRKDGLKTAGIGQTAKRYSGDVTGAVPERQNRETAEGYGSEAADAAAAERQNREAADMMQETPSREASGKMPEEYGGETLEMKEEGQNREAAGEMPEGYGSEVPETMPEGQNRETAGEAPERQDRQAAGEAGRRQNGETAQEMSGEAQVSQTPQRKDTGIQSRTMQPGILFQPGRFGRPGRLGRQPVPSVQHTADQQVLQPDAQEEQNRQTETYVPEQNAVDDEPKIDSVWQRFYKTYPKIQAFDYNGGCEILTIKPQDIGLLPRELWGYGNNSFLLHGYYNHRYLIFARLNNPKGRPRFLLGVPGHYYSNEKYMAAMFGFPNFVLSKVQPTGDDRFGYWYTDIRLGS